MMATAQADLLSAAGDIASVAAAIIAALAISGTAREVWRQTLGRRRDMGRRLRRLGVGAQVGFFEAVLGDPAALRGHIELADDPEAEAQAPKRRHQPKKPLLRRVLRRCPRDEYEEWPDTAIALPELDRHLWVFPDCYVEAFVDREGSVQGFTVTQRDRRFHPRFSFPPEAREHAWWRPWARAAHPFFDVALGKTRLANVIAQQDPSAVRAVATVRPWFYADLYWFGNPGYYLCFVTAASSSGNPPEVGDLLPVVEEIGDNGWRILARDARQWTDLAATQHFRQRTVATTYGVMSSQLLAERIPWWGPHGDEIRMLLGHRQ